MRQEVMDIVLKATDNASPTFEAVEDAAEDLEESVDRIGVSDEFDSLSEELNALLDDVYDTEEGFDELGDGADKAKEDVDKLGKESDETKEKVKGMGDESKSSGATMQMAFQNIADGVMRAKDGIVELGRNLMETLNLAGQQEQQETFLKMNIGAEGAAKQMKIINDLVADLPGDDVAIGGLLSQAAAKNAGITADELQRMGTNAADYFAAMSNYGKSSAEAQQDLTNYILTGNTAELERSPVLQGHIDKLKEAGSVEERNKALQEAMNEEGWAGISQQDTYNNKLETFTAMLDRGKRQMGEMFLDAAGGAMDFIGNLDEATGGVLGMGIAIGTVAAGPIVQTITGVGQMATGLSALKTAYEGTAVATAIAEGGFWSMAAAELAALWPILAIIAAVVAVGVAVYEVGKYFGWWTDVGSMLEAIQAGVQRLWSAFINNPDVQGFIKTLQKAWTDLQVALAPVINEVMKFFNVQKGGDFDIVRALIDGVGNAWGTVKGAIDLVIAIVKLLIFKFLEFKAKVTAIINKIRYEWAMLPKKIQDAISNLINIITKPFKDAYNGVKGAVDDIKAKAKSITHINIGSVTNKLAQPFKDAYNKIKDIVKDIIDKAKSIPSNIPVIGGFFGGEDLEFYGGSDLTTSSYSTEKLSVDMNQNINLSLDLRNVPPSMDERQLAGLINETLDSKEFINRLVNNPDFQSLDSKVKQRIVLKSNRANGRGV